MTVSELVTGVNVALARRAVTDCRAFDKSRDSAVTVEELVAGVSSLVAGCPSVTVIRVPAYGSSEDLTGIVRNFRPGRYRVAPYIYVQGWWTKPTFASPTVDIAADGSWTADITTGGCDRFSTTIAIYVVPAAVEPPQVAGAATLPAELDDVAVATVVVERGPPLRTLSFAGYEWRVKRFDCPAGPGPNLFSDRPEDVWVDENGELHLSIHQRDSQWYATEVILPLSFGYGTYVFQTRGRIDVLDPCVVVGLFTWDEEAPPAYREIDIEYSRWCNAEDPTNAQYVVQPFTTPGNLIRFSLDLSTGDSALTHVIQWSTGRVSFETYYGHHSLGEPPPLENRIYSWTNESGDVPLPGAENVRINFWLFNGNTHKNNEGAELSVTRFAYLRLSDGLR